MTLTEEIENSNTFIPNEDCITEESTEPEKDNVTDRLKKYPRSEDKKENFDLAMKFIIDNYKGAPRSESILYHLKKHFKLKTDEVAILKTLWYELYREHKVTQITIETPTESRKEAKEREDKEAKDERDRIHNEERKKKEEKKAIAEELYKILENEDGKHPEEEIEAIKKEIKEILLPDFWSIEGRNQNNPGHVVLQKLAISDYLNRTYRLIRYGGNNWHYDWKKGFYTYDSDDVLLHKEVTDIIRSVCDVDAGYTYNDNSIVDTLNIIHLASRREAYAENPFNKYTDLINARNGVLKVDYTNKKVTYLGKQPQYLFSYCIDCNYEPEIDNNVIHDLLGGKIGEEQRDLIYQMAAMAIRDTNPKLIPSKVAYLLIGRNADKYTVMHLLGKFFGHRIVTRLSLKEIATNKYTKPLLEGKLINLDDNLPENIPLEESRELKSLTGGKFHTLEPKHIKPYPGIITALLVFAGDNFPKCSISKNDGAFWDRWEIITFEKKPHQVDEDYLTNLLTPENLSGFFNRVMLKLFDIHDHKITRRNNALTTYDAWQGSSNTVYRFCNEMTVPIDERVEYPKDEFFKYYNDWCDGLDIPLEDRCKSLFQFDKDLSDSCRVKAYELKEDGKKRNYVYRMYRKYDSSRSQSSDDGDGDNDDMDIPDCGHYPRKR